MKNCLRFISICFLLLGLAFGNSFIMNSGSIHAQEDWKQEYADVCAKTQNAMRLSPEELRNYIDRCDTLLQHINELEGPQAATEKKVYTKRVNMCRDLYDFALQYKENKE